MSDSEDVVKLTPSPCSVCKKATNCLAKCPKFDMWFKGSWRKVVQPFREITEYKKEKEKEKRENELNMPNRKADG